MYTVDRVTLAIAEPGYSVRCGHYHIIARVISNVHECVISRITLSAMHVIILLPRSPCNVLPQAVFNQQVLCLILMS